MVALLAVGLCEVHHVPRRAAISAAVVAYGVVVIVLLLLHVGLSGGV
jgi:hypothetical protein